MELTEAKQIPKIVYNIYQAREALKRYHICLTDSDNDFILDEIICRDTIEYERNMSVDNNEE